MATKYELITELYTRTQKSVIAPQEWQRFLSTACRNFRLSFDEQLLLYAQRPDATAVLEIDKWNRQFGRWVNRGATGIAVFDDDTTGRARLKYYFDVSDTHPGRFSRRVPIWTMRREYEQEVTEALENSFGELENKYSLAAALISAAKNAVEDNMQDYLQELHYYKENSFLEELDELNIEVQYRNALQNSVAYMLLVRCGIDPSDYFTDDDFQGVVDFNTPQTLNALGVATGDIAQMCLTEISRTVTAMERQPKKQNRTFADVPKDEYPVIGRNNETERSHEHERADIHDAGRLPSAQPAAPAGAGGDAWEIRPYATPVSAAAPQSDLHQPLDQREANGASSGDRADGALPDGADHGADGESRGRDGGTESHRSDEMGGADERHPAGSGGNGADGADLQLTSDDLAATQIAGEQRENAGGSELPAFLNERLINAILSNPEDDLIYKKQQIEMYFAAHPDVVERAEYLKSAYQDRFTELLVGSRRTRVGYKPQEDGLLMWEGAYLSRSSESVFSWRLVVELTAQIIERGEYHINRDIKGLKSQDSQQMSLFDFDSSTPSPAEPAELVSHGIRYSQQVIDEALCIGANDRNSRLIVCAYFMKDKSVEDNARFLREHYGTNGAGFYLNDRQYSIWYSGEGIRLSSGDSAQGGTAMLISWEDAAKRIRELLDLGRYMPQVELDRVQDYEYQQIAESLWYLRQDFDDGAREQALLPTVNGIYMTHSSFPENTAQIAELLKQPDSLQTIVYEVGAFVNAYDRERNILRFHFHRPKEILQRLRDLQREPVIFSAAEGYDPQRRQFISMDEIDKLLCSGSTYYRLGVYSYYLEHPDIKERAKYLQNYHGTSGSYGGNDNTNYGSKGLSFSHGDLMAPYAKIEWKWNKAAQRIDTLIKRGRFLTLMDRVSMPDYERRELAIIIQGAFFDLPDSQPRPFTHNPIADYWKNVEEIQAQLTDPAKVEEIYQMLVSVADGTKPEDRYYTSRQDALAAMISYREGTYSLFGEKREPRPVEAAPQNTEPEELRTAKELINLYCQETFGSDAEYADLSHVDLAYSTTGDGEQPIEAFADLIHFKIEYRVGGEAVYINQCDSLAELNTYLAELDFDSIIVDAEDAFTEIKQEQAAPAGEIPAEEEQPAAAPSDRVDEMLRQAMLAAELSGQTGQNVFAFEEGSLQPVNAPTPAPTVEQPVTLAPPKQRRERVEFSVLRPEISAEKRHDFHITDQELGYGTPTEKYNANVEAIRTLQKIEAEGRLATPEEQEVLSRYVGWGGLADCFDERSSHYEELKSLLDEDEYAAARASTLTAFYTSPVIIEAVYSALSQMGFQTGNILEPACGVGNFIGMLPGSMAGSKAYGVEIDSISGRIAQQLYQNSRIAVDGFEKVQMPDSFFDVAVGNVPFGDFKVLDKQYDKYHWLIHDYFFGKTLDKVRPGGIVAFITSKGTMDKENSAVRKYLAQRADLIGAIRLPDNAFKRNAGTEVTSRRKH